MSLIGTQLMITELSKCDNITWQVVIGVLHHHNVPVLGVVDSKQSSFNSHLFSSLAVTERNVWLGGKYSPPPYTCLERSLGS